MSLRGIIIDIDVLEKHLSYGGVNGKKIGVMEYVDPWGKWRLTPFSCCGLTCFDMGEMTTDAFAVWGFGTDYSE